MIEPLYHWKALIWIITTLTYFAIVLVTPTSSLPIISSRDANTQLAASSRCSAGGGGFLAHLLTPISGIDDEKTQVCARRILD